jgi:serine/threonine-protein kinase
VRKAAKIHMSMEALVEAVATEVDDDADRAAFRKAVKGLSGKTQPPTQPSRPNSVVPTQVAAQRFDLAVLDKAEKRLAQYIGAIAQVVVKRAAMKARDVSELYLIIADEIADPADRKAFVKKAISAVDRG